MIPAVTADTNIGGCEVMLRTRQEGQFLANQLTSVASTRNRTMPWLHRSLTPFTCNGATLHPIQPRVALMFHQSAPMKNSFALNEATFPGLALESAAQHMTMKLRVLSRIKFTCFSGSR